MSIAELIKDADVNFVRFKNKEKSITNSELDEMGHSSSKSLGLDRQSIYYEVQQRKKKLESFGYKTMSLDDISTNLFGKKLKVVGVKEKLILTTGYHTYDYGMKNGSTKLKLNHYIKPTISIFGAISSYPMTLYSGCCDKVCFIDTPDGFFGLSKTAGYLSSPQYLNQPIPPELLGRMETLAKSSLINCFYAVGFEEAFSFQNDEIKIEYIDPIILAVIDEGTGVSSPFNQNTHMFFVGKYN